MVIPYTLNNTWLSIYGSASVQISQFLQLDDDLQNGFGHQSTLRVDHRRQKPVLLPGRYKGVAASPASPPPGESSPLTSEVKDGGLDCLQLQHSFQQVRGRGSALESGDFYLFVHTVRESSAE